MSASSSYFPHEESSSASSSANGSENFYTSESSEEESDGTSTSSSSSTSDEDKHSSQHLGCSFPDEDESLNWSQVSAVDVDLNDSWISYLHFNQEECCCSPFRWLKHCSLCFGPPAQTQRHDCFVAVDSFLPLLDRSFIVGNSPIKSYTPTLDRVDEHAPTSKTNIFTPLAQKILSCKKLLFRQDGSNKAPSGSLFSPIGSMGGTLTSSTTLHRRADISVGFFTFGTLEAIHSYDQEDSAAGSSTPSSKCSRSDGKRSNTKNYKTPAARPRLNSEAFRKTIGEVVTCEKRANSDEDVSPIESEDGFSTLLLNVEGRKSESSTSSKSLLGGSGKVQKRLVYDDAIDRVCDSEHDTAEEFTTKDEHTNGPLFLEAIESIGALFKSPIKPLHQDNKKSIQLEPTPRQPTTREGPSSQEHLYLRRSISFIKALRRNGHKGSVLIQGWVAFRQNVSWKEVSLCTKRCDFRYIVLLNDMPILHVFSSKPKHRKGEPKANLLERCISLDLTKDIQVGVSLASKELGHEVYLVESESNKFICSMLPVAMKNLMFLDRHRSRLAQGNVLSGAFRKSDRIAAVQSHDCRKISNQSHATIEQNDTARHLLFVLSAAITFPPQERRVSN